MDAGDASPAPADAAGTFGASACWACRSGLCASEVSGCTDDPGCTAYVTCLLACPEGEDGNVDATCAAACPAAGSSVTAEDVVTLNTCLASGPAASCAACGADAGVAYAILHQSCPVVTSASNPCAAAGETACCKTEAACLANPSCVALSDCFDNCNYDDVIPDAGPDAGYFPSCREACIAASPKGLEDFVLFYACYDFTASAECGGVPGPCNTCLEAYCVQATINLNVAPGGFGVYDCVYDPACAGGPVCEMQCEEEYPGAVKALEEYEACQINACPVCGN